MGKKKGSKDLTERVVKITAETKKAIDKLAATQAQAKRQLQQLQINMSATEQAIGLLLLSHLESDEQIKSYDETVGAIIAVKKPTPPKPQAPRVVKKRDKKANRRKRR